MAECTNPFQVIILTLFPEVFPGPLAHGLIGKALIAEKWQLNTINLRDFATDTHKTVDDTPYGGGAGMVLKPEIVAAGIRQAKEQLPSAPVVFVTPAGVPFQQVQAQAWSTEAEGLILLCGQYEGIDQRVLDSLVDHEVSIGDYVLTGGEVPALVMTEAVVRLLPGVLGNHVSADEESFSLTSEQGEKLLEYPHYTRPAVWEGQSVPAVLISGDHAKIAEWRQAQAAGRTRARRPDLLKTKA
jgi:tRNA (guanine37-N1)-methyltransferase